MEYIWTEDENGKIKTLNANIVNINNVPIFLYVKYIKDFKIG